MSLWTPSGEHPVGDDRPDRAGEPGGEAPSAGSGAGAGGRAGGPGSVGDGAQADIDALRQQLSEAPADMVVANHCYGLFELAALYLSDSPPHLDNARLAIDALGFLVDGLGERLGEAHPSLRDALAQIRLAFVQISAAQEQPGQQAGTGTGAGPE
jgi:hypothetical protein